MVQVKYMNKEEDITNTKVAQDLKEKLDNMSDKEVPIDIVSPIVAPHTKKSRLVTDEDVAKVASDAAILYALCFEKSGMYLGAYAMHHSQINDTDPLSFWVTVDREIIVNPVIKRHTRTLVDSKEGCMSFGDKPQIIVPRWHKLEVEYQTVMVDPENKEKFKLSSIIEKSLSGHDSFIFQHEFDHGEGKFIYKLE